MTGAAPRTLFQKVWDAHVVAELGGGAVLLYIDRHLVNEAALVPGRRVDRGCRRLTGRAKGFC